MPRGGHNRKTDQEHDRAGTRNTTRHGKPDEKVEFANVDAIDPPAGLLDSARREWFRILPILRDAGVLSAAYKGVITRYCVLYARVVEDEPNLFDKALDCEYRQYAVMLGLSPQSVARLTAGSKAGKRGGKFDDL